jgi:hypothetical protein
MPRDVIVQLSIEDHLSAHGIVPVAPQIITAHKRKTLAKHPHRAYARWIEATLPDDIERRLANLTCYKLPQRAAAPAVVINLAMQIKERVPDAQFVLGYFDKDPYLAVCLGESRAYLALWTNRRRLKAVAHFEDGPSERALRLRAFWL